MSESNDGGAPLTCADESRLTRMIVSRLMEAGIVLSMLLIVAGILTGLVAEHGDMAGGPWTPSAQQASPADLAAIIRGAASLDGTSLILLGLLLFILTPVLRVAISFLSFVIEKDYAFASLTAYVLVILIISFFLGRAE